VKYTLFLLDQAVNEYAKAAEWYEGKADGLGERFVKAIEARLLLIQQYPERFPKRKANFRESPVQVILKLINYFLIRAGK
jgi:hypothetical protein